ncbi:NAD(P)-binding protein [Aspergillus cavernicola]|uniref:NAD(P)-binding protein n=1 Tax=Aspergillus cavernicola TaxID=176166 RepID=A0ABR4HL29_9EURO
MPSYASAHATPNGAGDARPTALQIIHDENLTSALKGKVIVITGATSGIGLETARALSATGATLFLTARDIPTAKTALSDILEDGRVSLIEMDNSSLKSIRRAAGEILAAAVGGQVNILIANAGVMGIPEKNVSEDGFEMHFATNYLGHFLLFQLLKPALLASASETFSSRVVAVSSSAHRAGGLENWDYNFDKSSYDHNAAYANTKLATVYLANEIDRRFGGRCNLHATSLHPGGIDTGISRNIGREFVEMLLNDESMLKIVKSKEQGAATTVLAAVGREWEGRGGRYLEDCDEARKGVDDGNVFGVGFVERTYDEVAEGRLWGMSLGLVGMEDE